MTQEDIIRMARKIWGERAVLPFNELERFAALVAANEREECARVCEWLIGWQTAEERQAVDICAEAIRARGE